MKYLIIILSCFKLVSCGYYSEKNKMESNPLSTLHNYIDAVKNKDSKAIYGMLSKARRYQLSETTIKKAMKEYQLEFEQQLEALSNILKQERLSPIINVILADGEIITLKEEGGKWKVTGGFDRAVSQNTPQETISALYKALLRRDYFLFFKLLTTKKQEELETEITSLIQRLKRVDTLSVVIEGDKATVEYLPGHYIELILEDGKWKINDIK